MITWIEPDARGTPITTYNVKIKTASGDYILDDSFCNKIKDLGCLIPMSVLNDMTLDYKLTLGILI